MRIIVTLNQEQEKALGELMSEDLQSNRSGYFGFLIAQEHKRRIKNAIKGRKIKK